MLGCETIVEKMDPHIDCEMINMNKGYHSLPQPRRYYFHDRLSIFLSVCKQDYANITVWISLKKIQKMGLSQTLIPLNFESDLDHCLDTKKIPEFSHFLIIP